MNKKTVHIFLISLIGAAFLIGFFAYPFLPEQVASHWNASGQADGSLPKLFGIFLFPFVMTCLYGLFVLIPKIDPMRKNIESFRKHYDMLWILILVFFFYIFLLSLVWNFEYHFSFSAYMIPALAIFWFVLGVILENSKRNWFVGIRTPWTLSDDMVWEKTHALGGKLFKISAIISLLGFFAKNDALLIVLIAAPAGIIACVTVIYSYVEFRKKARQK